MDIIVIQELIFGTQGKLHLPANATQNVYKDLYEGVVAEPVRNSCIPVKMASKTARWSIFKDNVCPFENESNYFSSFTNFQTDI